MAASSAGSPLPAGRAEVAITAAGTQWKRRRDVASPAALRTVGGATAPTTAVMLHTPPPLRQRTVAFDISGADMDAKLEHFKQQVVAEFVRVHGDIKSIQDETLNSVTGDAFHDNAMQVEQKMTRADALMAALGAGTQEVAERLTAVELSDVNSRHLLDKAAANEVTLMDKLKVLEDELQR